MRHLERVVQPRSAELFLDLLPGWGYMSPMQYEKNWLAAQARKSA